MPTQSKPSWTVVTLFTLLMVYGPCCLGFLADCAHCRGVWLMLWPVIPGGVASEWLLAMMRWSGGAGVGRYLLAAALTAAWIALLILVGRLGKRWFVGSLVVAMLSSLLATWIAYQVVRA